MKHTGFFNFSLGLLALSALVFSACSPAVGPATSTGKIQISLENNINARTLEPSINMNAASYSVTGVGPGDATFSAFSAGEPVIMEGLAIGSWTIVVNASNLSAELIGTGTANAQVNAGATTDVAVAVTPIAGSGTLSLAISWPASQVGNPSILASLTPALGVAQALDFTVEGAIASYSNLAVPTGYYTLAFTMLDNGSEVAGAAEVVRIVDGQATSGSFVFSDVNAAPGSLNVTINTNLQNPLLVSIAGAQATLSVGSTQTLTASVSNYADSVVYEWFVNGAIHEANGSSFVFGSGMAIGYNRIDVSAYNADRSQAGSATQNVQIIAASTVISPAAVNLGTAGNFVILAKSAISTVPASAVTGDIGVSPAAASFITGFSLIADATNVFSTSSQITGKAYAADYAVPSPSNMTTAVLDMEAAYTDAAGRSDPNFTELYTGDISGQTLLPGLYKWGTGVMVNTDVTLSGGPNDVWIFQISQNLTLASGTKVILAGGALAKNVFWQAMGVVNLGTTAHIEGIVLSKTSITLATGASVNGRLLAQTAVALDANAVVQPAE